MNGELFLLYALQEGGLWSVRKLKDDQEWDELRASGKIDITPGWFGDSEPREVIRPALIAQVRVEKNFDFVLGQSRG